MNWFCISESEITHHSHIQVINLNLKHECYNNKGPVTTIASKKQHQHEVGKHITCKDPIVPVPCTGEGSGIQYAQTSLCQLVQRSIIMDITSLII